MSRATRNRSQRSGASQSTDMDENDKESMEEIFNKLDQTIANCDFEQLQDTSNHKETLRGMSSTEMHQAISDYSKHRINIQDKLVRQVEQDDPNSIELFKKYQEKSDSLLEQYGTAYNDVVSMDARCQRNLGEVFVTASSNRLRTNNDFNWVLFKNNIRNHLKKNAREAKLSSSKGFLFEYAFPTALKASQNDTRLDYDFSSINWSAVDELESEEPQTQKKRRDLKGELKKNTQVSQPTLSVKNKEEDKELIQKIRNRIIEIEKQHHRKPMPFAKLACDPESFQKTVENFAKLCFLLQQGDLLYFVENDEQMVITKHNAEKTNLNVAEVGVATQYLHYDMKTWKDWIERYNITRSYFGDI